MHMQLLSFDLKTYKQMENPSFPFAIYFQWKRMDLNQLLPILKYIASDDECNIFRSEGFTSRIEGSTSRI